MTRSEARSARSVDEGWLSLPGLRLLLIATAAQLVLLGIAMPLSALSSGSWFFNIDNPFHIYQLELGRAMQAQWVWMGYDPFFGAGHLAGLSSNVSARLTLLVAAFLPATVSTETVYAVYVVVCSLIAPLAIWALGQLLGWSKWHKILALVIGLLLWWVGVFRWYHTAGMVSFVCASYVAPVYAVWAYSLCNPNAPTKPAKMLWAGLAGGAGIWLHPLFCIPAVLLFLSILLLSLGRQRLWPLLLRAAAIALVVVLVNLPWVLALVQIDAQISGEQPYQKAVGLKIIFNSMGFAADGATGAWINLLLVAICSLGIWMDQGKHKLTTWPFLSTGLFLLLFASFGGISSTVGYVQPNRFIGPAYLMIGMVAAYYLSVLIGWANVGESHARRAGLLTVAALVALFFGRELLREITPGTHGHHGKAPPEISAPPPVVARLEDWINGNTSADGRILFETSLARVHGGGHVAGYLAARTGREFMGAAYPYFLAPVSCWDKSCFGRSVPDIQPAFFLNAIETYNVGWIVAHSSNLKGFLHQLPGITKLVEYDGVSIFGVEGPRTFVERGSGRILARSFNRIDVADVSGQTLILRYHWVRGLETIPPSRIEAYSWSPNFPPLIRIENPPENFVLRLAK